MTDNAGYRPTDDSALRWEDCHCVKCGEPDKQCKCVALTPGTKVIPTTDAITDLCEDCNERPITGLDALCDVCRNNANERAYQRDMEEPTYRGGEYEASVAHEMAEARKLK